MNQTKIKAEIVADSVNQQGDRLTSLLITFPRILLSEINTHRMLSKNTSSSRAIPFHKMVKAIQENPFIPIAWQKEHTGMQGYDYFNVEESKINRQVWLEARDSAVENAQQIHNYEITKQLANRLLEPFMWTTMLITGSKEGWDNFFNLRCPQYQPVANVLKTFRSKKDAIRRFPSAAELTEINWFKNNKGQAEIHMMALAECIYDAMNESTPKQLRAGEWHIPMRDKIDNDILLDTLEDGNFINDKIENYIVKISTAMAAHTSYTIVGGEAVKSYEKWIELHDKLIAYDPPHSSPMEHCCICVTKDEYNNSLKGQEKGWFRNYKGFKSYRQIIETEKYGNI